MCSASHLLKININCYLCQIWLLSQFHYFLGILNVGLLGLVDFGFENKLAAIQIDFMLVFDLALVVDEGDESID